ncbi:putative glucose-6-phosphate 1-epimerase [Glycine soja]
MSSEKSPSSASASASSSSSYELSKGINGLDKVILRDPRGSSAEVYLYGAHVTSWKNEQAEELLFLSSKAIFKPPKPIRGGIPICFPQFSNLGPLDSHGFARNRFWTIDDSPPPFLTNTPSKAFVDLILKPSEDDIKIWPHRVALGSGGDLMMTSRIRNTNIDGKPFSFTFANHTYFSVEVRVEGLETLDYLDNLQKRERFTEQGDALTFESEFDRIYLSTPTKIAILDHEKKRTIVLRKDGLPDAVVWNPWDKKAKAMSDFGDDEYKYMLCVEAAAIEKPITLKPGEEWKGRLELSTVPSSYCSGQLDPKKVIQGS